MNDYTPKDIIDADNKSTQDFERRDVRDQLPGWLQENKNMSRFFDSVVNNWFQPAYESRVSGFVGQKVRDLDSEDYYISESTPDRTFYQLEPGTTITDDNGDLSAVESYIDCMNEMEVQGSNTNNHNRLFNTDFWCWTPPINIDMFTNYYNYYWVESGPKAIEITVETNVILDIIGKQYYTLDLGNDETFIFQSGQKIVFKNDVNLEYNDVPFIVDNVGRAIMLIDNAEFEDKENTLPDYIIMDRGSSDDNQWSYGNRWFHKEQIHTEDNIQQDYKQASRPILCFERNIQLRDAGKFYRKEVDAVLFGSKASIENTQSTIIDGVILKDDMRILVVGDPTADVNNKIYKVTGLSQFGYVILTIENDGLDETGNSVFGESIRVKSGDTYGQTNFHYDGNNWEQSQIKTKRNQQPLFELYDFNRTRLDDQGVYPESTFHGNGIFSYATDDEGQIDPVLGINAKYNDMGNLIFSNLCETESYEYYENDEWMNIEGLKFYRYNKTIPTFSTVTPIATELGTVWYDITNKVYKVLVAESTWSVITYITDVTPVVTDEVGANLVWWDTGYDNFKEFNPLTQTWEVFIDNPDEYHSNWNYSNWKTRQYVSQEYPVTKNQSSDGSYSVERYYDIEHLPQAFVEGEPVSKFLFINKEQKTYGQDWEITADDQLHIFETVELNERDALELQTFDEKSNKALEESFYNIPNNLQSNPNNNDILEISYNDAFNHFISIISNQDALVGQPYGENNYSSTPRDLSKGTEILSYISPMLKMMIINKLDYTKTRGVIDLVRNRYLNYRGKLSQTITNMININEITEADSLTSDKVDETITKIFERMDLGKNDSFAFYNTGMIKDAYMPSTPSFLGMHPLFKPQVALVTDFPTPKHMLQCHDGSYENLYGDYIEQEIVQGVYSYGFTDWRDTFMINIEQQIYDNALEKFKKEPSEYSWHNVLPGKFRDSDYSHSEYLRLTQPIFEKWVIENNIDYKSNTTYSPDDWKTWNWSLMIDKDGEPLLGNYRGIYRYFYDTDRPHTHPWEMFGFGEEPDWWNARYGASPMTSQNHKFWNDVKTGYIAEGAFRGYDKRFARPDIFDYIPMNEEGELVSPFSAGITKKQPTAIQASIPWKYGDGSIYEWFWWYTPSFGFDVQTMSYILSPVNWLERTWDTEHIETIFRHTPYQQIIYSNLNKRPSSSDIVVHNELDDDDNEVRVVGNSQWYSASVRNNGQDVTTYLGKPLRTMEPQLTYKSGSYIRQDSLSFVSDIAGLIPETNVSVLFNKSAVIKQYYYSALVIGWNGSNYTVSGYNPIESFITVRDVYTTGKATKVSVSGVDAVIYNKFKTTTSTYQYGDSLATIQDVVNVITGYGQWLTEQGWLFNVYDDVNSEMIDWLKATKDFLGWVSNPLEVGDVSVLNPGYGKLSLVSEHGQIDDMTQFVNGSWLLLDINQFPISDDNIEIYRESSSVSIETLSSMIGYMRVCAVEYEHVVVFDNETTFGKIIYDPTYNIRQPRFRTFYTKTDMWDGTLFAPGYVIKNDGAIPNFEKNANDIRYYYNTDSVANAGIISEHSKSLIGYVDKDYMKELLLDDRTMFDFYKGFIREKGTVSVFNKLMRSTYLMTPGDFKIYEDWLFKIGEYGATDYKNYIEFNIRQEDLKANPQTVHYSSDPFLEDTENDIIEISYKDDRWVKKNLVPRNDMFVNRDFQTDGYNDLPTGGFARLGDSKYTVANRTELEELWNTTDKALKPNDYIWLVNDIDGSWNMYKTILVGEIVGVVSQGDEEVVGNDLAIIRTDRPTYLEVGDKIIVSTETKSKPTIDGYQTVSELGEDSSSFVVDVPMTEGYTYDENEEKPMILKLVSMKISKVEDLPDFSIQTIYTDDFSSAVGWTLGTDITITNDKLNFNVTPVKSEDIGTGDDVELIFNTTLSHLPVESVESLTLDGTEMIGFEFDYATGDIIADELDTNGTNHLDTTTGVITLTFIEAPVLDVVIALDYSGDIRFASKDILAQAGNSYSITYTMTDYTSGRVKSYLGGKEYWTDHSFVSEDFTETTYTDYITADVDGIIKFGTDIGEGFVGSITNLTVTEYKMMTLDNNDRTYVSRDTLVDGNSELKPIINDPDNIASTSDYINQDLWTVFDFDTTISGWILSRIENDRVNSYTIDDLYLLNKNDLHTVAKLITFDPVKNVIDGRAMSEIALTLSYDPAQYSEYNNSTVNERVNPWYNKPTGQVWWDLSQVRYVDYEQGDLVYRKKNWGHQLPGSEVNLYEWTRSPVKPEDWDSFISDSSATKDLGYEPSGEPRMVEIDGDSITPFNERQEWNNATNSYETWYYFWVKNPINVPPQDFRNISTMQAKKLIESPQKEGVMWFAPIYSGYDGQYYDSAFVMSNTGSVITDDSTIIQINFKKDGTRDLNVHKQWEIIRDEFNSIIPDTLWSKMKDSLVSFDKTGKTVPDLNLDESVRYGNNIRPRQSWFKDINSSREVFILTINDLFDEDNLIEIGSGGTASGTETFQNVFYSEDPIPADTEYDYETETKAERDYLYQNEAGDDKRVLVHNDSSEDGRWTISTWNNTTKVWTLNEKQLYVMTDYWDPIDWYNTSEGVDENTVPNYEVETFSDRETLTGLKNGDVIKIKNGNSSDVAPLWILQKYSYTNEVASWSSVGVEDGTVEFNDTLYNLDSSDSFKVEEYATVIGILVDYFNDTSNE